MLNVKKLALTIDGKNIFEKAKHALDVQKADFNEITSEQSYKKIHRVNFKRRDEMFSQLSSEKSLDMIVKERRKKLSFFENIKNSFQQIIYVKIFSSVNKIAERNFYYV